MKYLIYIYKNGKLLQTMRYPTKEERDIRFNDIIQILDLLTLEYTHIESHNKAGYYKEISIKPKYTLRYYL